MTEHVAVADADRVRTIRFNRPEKKNALTRAMYDAAAEALETARGAGVRVCVFAGGEGVFTAGNDLGDFMEAPPHIGGDETPPVERFMRALLETPMPVIAAVDGLAIGIGTTMLLHCDLAYASDRAIFRTPFVDLGLAPEFGASMVMPSVLGRVVAGDLLINSAMWDAEKALARGLVTDVFPADSLEKEVMARAGSIAAKAPSAVRAAKQLMTRPEEPLIERIIAEGSVFAELLASDEFKEAAAAFMEKRKPDFSRFD
ncbi:enoyl-CoA hydratase [Marinicauda salina]|uniref:Enoyl-CoA hydratase n=1 Tax=Marinicauda salina TaxID=2135793 RepID=A0A2U2BUN9_9PROT|nr:enoyl-CoA hydratase-related protein [Marinicauda salina]PWE17674.1 enoyl-CoA hydratase [Marinicauda salina]